MVTYSRIVFLFPIRVHATVHQIVTIARVGTSTHYSATKFDCIADGVNTGDNDFFTIHLDNGIFANERGADAFVIYL